MIENLIKRLLVGVSVLQVVKNLKLLIDGFAVEFYRFIDFKDETLRSVVPNANMSVNSIDNYNVMFGIPSSLGGTDAEKIARIIERADIVGYPGKAWLQSQVQNAGYPLYVIEQEILAEYILQWGDFQFSENVQFGITARFQNPATIPGELIVNQPYAGLGKIFISQYGPAVLTVYGSMYGDIQYGLEEYGTVSATYINQYGTAGFQYGTPDLNYSYPRAKEYTINEFGASRWGFYFFLSPFPDRLANANELLAVSVDEYNYLTNLVIRNKLTRNYCIAQVEII